MAHLELGHCLVQQGCKQKAAQGSPCLTGRCPLGPTPHTCINLKGSWAIAMRVERHIEGRHPAFWDPFYLESSIAGCSAPTGSLTPQM